MLDNVIDHINEAQHKGDGFQPVDPDKKKEEEEKG